MCQYKVLLSELPALERKIRATGRKLDKYGLKWRFEILGEAPECVGVYSTDGRTIIKTGTVVLDVVAYDFWMEPLKVGRYTPVAVIDHTALVNPNGTLQNMVHAFEGTVILPEWYDLQPNCQHCHTRRARNKTVILRDANGNTVQVGTACVKDFTGIDAADIIRSYADIHDIIDETPRAREEHAAQSVYTDTAYYLAQCVSAINAFGYCKTAGGNHATRTVAASRTPTGADKAQAAVIISHYTDKNPDDYMGFERDVITSCTSKYCRKNNGIVAYAPVAYAKELAKITAEKTKQESDKISKHVGNLGEKITVNLTLLSSYSFDSQYGPTFYHVFIDEAGNLYKWATGKAIENADKPFSVVGTVKAHSEYRGVNQTILTRCKVS